VDINAYMLVFYIDLVSNSGRKWLYISFLYYGILTIFKLFNYEATLNIGFNPALTLIERLIIYGCNNFTTWVSNPLKTPSYSLLCQHPLSPQPCELNTLSEQLMSEGLVLFLLYYPYVYYIVYVHIGYWVCYRMDIKKGYPHFY